MTHFSALTADVGASGSIPWLPPASPARRPSWVPKKMLSHVRITCDHIPPSRSKAPFQPRLGRPRMILCQVQHFLPLGQLQGCCSRRPRLSPLPSESQNLPSWEKEGRTGLAETMLAQLPASLPRTSAGREILLLLAWLRQLLPSPQKGTPPSSPRLASEERLRVQLVGVSLQRKTAGEWTGGCRQAKEAPVGWECSNLYSSAQRLSLALCLVDSAWAHRNLRLEFRKTLQSPLTKPCPSAVPFGATCWSTSAPTFSPSIPLGASLALVRS